GHLFGGAGRHSGFGGVFWGRWRQPRNRLVDLESVYTRKNRRYCLRGRLYGEPLGRGLQGGGLAVVGAQVEKCTSWCRRNLRESIRDYLVNRSIASRQNWAAGRAWRPEPAAENSKRIDKI